MRLKEQIVIRLEKKNNKQALSFLLLTTLKIWLIIKTIMMLKSLTKTITTTTTLVIECLVSTIRGD